MQSDKSGKSVRISGIRANPEVGPICYPNFNRQTLQFLLRERMMIIALRTKALRGEVVLTPWKFLPKGKDGKWSCVKGASFSVHESFSTETILTEDKTATVHFVLAEGFMLTLGQLEELLVVIDRVIKEKQDFEAFLAEKEAKSAARPVEEVPTYKKPEISFAETQKGLKKQNQPVPQANPAPAPAPSPAPKPSDWIDIVAKPKKTTSVPVVFQITPATEKQEKAKLEEDDFPGLDGKPVDPARALEEKLKKTEAIWDQQMKMIQTRQQLKQ